MIQQVGKTVIKNGNKQTNLCYRDVLYDDEGWADASKYLPHEYDLMFLKYVSGKIIQGWCVGKSWDGLRIDPKQKVINWKRKLEDLEE